MSDQRLYVSNKSCVLDSIFNPIVNEINVDNKKCIWRRIKYYIKIITTITPYLSNHIYQIIFMKPCRILWFDCVFFIGNEFKMAVSINKKQILKIFLWVLILIGFLFLIRTMNLSEIYDCLKSITLPLILLLAGLQFLTQILLN